MEPEATLLVAGRSKQKAEHYLEKGNPGRAFAHQLVALKLCPEWKSDLRFSFSSTLCTWGEQLESQQRYKDLFHCYEQALDIFPESEEIVSNLGAHLFRLGHLKEASHYFRQALSTNPDFLPALKNLQSISNLVVERWHFRMLNDTMRNDAYREAIIKKVKQGHGTVLDIGTGTGILSMFAVEAGAENVFACDYSCTMIQIASEVLAANGMEGQVRLLNKMSTDLKIPQDIRNKVSLVVTETMDVGLLGEHVLETLSHAWESLLLPACPTLRGNSKHNKELLCHEQHWCGIVVPFGAVVSIAGIECDAVVRKSKLLNMRTLQLLGIENIQIVVEKEEEYDSIDLAEISDSFRYLVMPKEVLYVNFNDPEEINRHISGENACNFDIVCVAPGRLDALVLWFKLQLDEDISLSTSPESESCWEQALFPLKTPVEVKPGDKLLCSLNCGSKVSLDVKFEGSMTTEDGIKGDSSAPDFKLVELFSELQTSQSFTITLTEDVVSFLNNDKWIEALASLPHNITTWRDRMVILDLSPFPLLGLQVLKACRESKLVCVAAQESTEKAIKYIASLNNIQSDQLLFLKDQDVEDLGIQFDCILVDPIDRKGELDEKALLQIPSLRRLLKDGGVILPKKLSVVTQVVESDWLTKASHVLDDSHTCGYRVAEFINAYQVNYHLELALQELKYRELSKPIKVLEIDLKVLDDKSSFCLDKCAEVGVINKGSANALPYWFEVELWHGITSSTLHSMSHIYQAAILVNPGICVDESTRLTVAARYQQGLVNIKINQCVNPCSNTEVKV